MTIEETKQKILTDDEFVLSEIQRVRYLYRLKKEIRYAQERHSDFDTESVAEHVYGMHVIAQYFLPLEDSESRLDKEKVFQMITWHDIDEIETGDTISYLKTDGHRAEAKKALPKVLKNLPNHLQATVRDLLDEYETQQTFEAKFTKAVDKSEPLFEMWEESYRGILQGNKNTVENHWSPRREYVKNFPCINRFVEVATDRLVEKGYFYKDVS